MEGVHGLWLPGTTEPFLRVRGNLFFFFFFVQQESETQAHHGSLPPDFERESREACVQTWSPFFFRMHDRTSGVAPVMQPFLPLLS